ncbi:hypothetical protein D1872_346930 [compost metagenome]
MRANIIATNLHAQRVFAAVEHTHQFNHTFTRDNDGMVGQRHADGHRADRQTVAIGRHGTQFFTFGFEQHAV